MKFVPLAESEKTKSSPCYKYLSEPLMEIRGEEEKRLLNLRPDPSLALRFKDRAKIQTPEHVIEPEGVYITKDSGIIVSTCIEVPNLTAEMLNWYMIWHQLDPIRYTIWNPEDHYDISITKEDRARFLDNSIPLAQRIWGTTSHVNESMNGEKPENININFHQPSKLGYKDELVGTESCQSMVCSFGIEGVGPVEVPVTMTEILRKGPNGVNVWLGHWWVGCGVIDGKEVIKPIPEIAAQKVARLIVHNHKEVAHLNKILPKLYAEFGNKPLDQY